MGGGGGGLIKARQKYGSVSNFHNAGGVIKGRGSNLLKCIIIGRFSKRGSMLRWINVVIDGMQVGH